MLNFWLCIGICAIIWFANGIYIIKSIKEKISSEFYMHTGLSIFFCVMVLELTIGNDGGWNRLDSLWLQIIGFVLYLPSGFLVVSSIIALRHVGKSKGADFTESTIIIREGIYGRIRQPMTLGLAIWSIAFILVFQSVTAVILCIISIFCFWMAARKESIYNIRKFGDDYEAYIKRVPMWNLFRKPHEHANSEN
jgi:protein-S-isoprenylcysteine O-methyltransferase Ste14